MGVVRAQILGFALAPAKTRRAISAREAPARSLEEYFLIRSSESENAFSPLARLPISRSPCEISIVRGGPVSPQKLLRFGLRIGSPRKH
jgi:hypothetical protein